MRSMMLKTHGAVDAAAHAEHLPGEEPVQEADGQLALVVGRDGHIHVLQRGVAVAEGDHRHVHVRGLLHGLHCIIHCIIHQWGQQKKGTADGHVRIDATIRFDSRGEATVRVFDPSHACMQPTARTLRSEA